MSKELLELIEYLYNTRILYRLGFDIDRYYFNVNMKKLKQEADKYDSSTLHKQD